MAVDDKTVVVAEPSPAAEKTNTQILKELTPKQMKDWRATGNLPEDKAETKAESSPAAKVEVAAPEKAEEPAKSAVVEKEPVKHNAETRIKDLLAENKELKSKLQILEKPVAPAKKEEAFAKPLRTDVDEKTGQMKYATDEAFLDARDKWIFDEASRKVRGDIAREENDRKVAQQNELNQRRMLNSIKITTEKHPDFLEALKAKEIEKDGKKITVFEADAVKRIKTNSVLDAWILKSDIGMEILYHLAKNPDEVDRIQELDAFDAARMLTKLEDKLDVTSAPAPNKGSTDADKKVSKAPAPATNVAGKATAPLDEELAATEAGDFKRFQKAANETDWRKKKAS